MMTTPQSHTAQIRKTLNTAFDDSTLSAFCLDYFPEVYDCFSQGMRKDDKITHLLDYCRRQPAGFEILLKNVLKEYTFSAQSSSTSDFPREELKPLIEALSVYIDSSLPIADSIKDKDVKNEGNFTIRNINLPSLSYKSFFINLCTSILITIIPILILVGFITLQSRNTDIGRLAGEKCYTPEYFDESNLIDIQCDEIQNNLYMKTEVGYSSTQKIAVITSVVSDRLLFGFTGHVTVCHYLNEDEPCHEQQLGVNGRAIPGAPSDRTENWICFEEKDKKERKIIKNKKTIKCLTTIEIDGMLPISATANTDTEINHDRNSRAPDRAYRVFREILDILDSIINYGKRYKT